jgi:predicted metal-dependent phosphoesterase TrpH
MAATPEEAFRSIHDAGGVASVAHPGLTRCDEMIPGFAAVGLDAVEAFHTEHDAAATERYLQVAATLGLCVTGGSDFHGDTSHGASAPGATSLPREHYNRLLELKRS